MAIENATYIADLDSNLPSAADAASQGDDHIRLAKRVLKTQFPNLGSAPVTATAAQLNAPFPIGGIIDWYGTINAIPAGWAYCNGQTVARSDGTGNITTPDLRDRFVLCAGTAAPGTTGGSQALSATTSTAGAHSHSGNTDVRGGHSHGGATAATALGIEHMPPHNHDLGFTAVGFVQTPGTGAYIALSAIGNFSTTGARGNGVGHGHGIYGDGDHAHGVSTNAAGDHAHTASIADGRPPFHVLAKIMKV